MRRRTVVLLSLLGVVGVLLRTFAMDAKTYRVRSETMVPTVQIGDRVTFNQGAYDDSAPRIGDIVVAGPRTATRSGYPARRSDELSAVRRSYQRC